MLWLYYAIFSASVLALLGFVFLLICLFFQFPWKTVVKVLLVCSLFGSWFVFQKWQQEEASQHLVNTVDTVRILPDTIKVNGDSLSFRGKADGRIFQVYYKLQSEAEKKKFQDLSELHEMAVKGKLASPQGANNFAGFGRSMSANRYAMGLSAGVQSSWKVSKGMRVYLEAGWNRYEGVHSMHREPPDAVC